MLSCSLPDLSYPMCSDSSIPANRITTVPRPKQAKQSYISQTALSLRCQSRTQSLRARTNSQTASPYVRPPAKIPTATPFSFTTTVHVLDQRSTGLTQ